MKKLFVSFVFCFSFLCKGMVIPLQDVKPILEGLYNCKQQMVTQLFINGEYEKVDAQTSRISGIINQFIDYIAKSLAPENIKKILPDSISIDTLSEKQREAVVLYCIQLDDSGHIKTLNNLLSGAINILSEDVEDPVSSRILQSIIKETPRKLLEDSDFL